MITIGYRGAETISTRYTSHTNKREAIRDAKVNARACGETSTLFIAYTAEQIARKDADEARMRKFFGGV